MTESLISVRLLVNKRELCRQLLIVACCVFLASLIWFLGWAVLARFGLERSIAPLRKIKYWAIVSAEKSDSDCFLMLLSLSVGF